MQESEREPRAGPSRSQSLVASHASRKETAPAFSAGVNPLFGSEVAPAMPPGHGGSTKSISTESHGTEATTVASPGQERPTSAAVPEPASKGASVQTTGEQQRQRSSKKASMTRQKRSSSPQSTLTTSTTQSDSSRRVRPVAAPTSQAANSHSNPTKQQSSNKSAPASRNGSINKGSSNKKEEFIPAPLVPALVAPVPPPPSKRRSVRDIEAAEEDEETTGQVLEDAPDKTLMEMLQTYLKKQDLYTRMVLIVVLLVLAGGVLGAYALMIWYAIDRKDPKYIVVVSVISIVLVWVLWKYCFSGDQMLQDQSQIAQDIATLYAAIPDHTAAKGVSEKGRAQFTDFKYEKSEMMFTAVTDDGVSLGSERGSELMMDGADPSCPMCNKAYVEGAQLSLLPCLHVFHKACIHKWCDRHIVCPLCKRHLEAAEPLHTLTAAYNGGATAQSEPGGGNRGNGNSNQRNQWRGVLGTAAPGPASAHGSERGLGGTRSEDGMWNDRVLNAAQQQMVGRTHNRVTSFSSETRRANSMRGRVGERSTSGGRGAPPHSSSTGQRSQNLGGTGGWHHQQQGRLHRKRSSSFNTASEHRGRNGSGRVAQGTAPHRGNAGSLIRADCSMSPRSRSDLGVGSRDGDRMRANSDAMLSLHASRRNNGAGGTKVLTKPLFVDDVGSGTEESKGDSRTGTKQPAVITVRKATAGKAKSAIGVSSSSSSGKPKRETSGSGARDMMRSGGESESDFGGERDRVFGTNTSRFTGYHEDDSDEDVTTKALTYGPRKPRSSSIEKAKDGPGHRRQSSAGSTTSADEVNGSCRAAKPRRRPSGSKVGSGTQGALATAAATAEAVSKLLNRSSQDERASVFNSRGNTNAKRSAKGKARRSSRGGASDHGLSDGDSGSDARAPVRRKSRGGGSTVPSVRSDGGMKTTQPTQEQSQQQSQQQQQQQPQQLKSTPTRTVPVTKGTPAPPMAAARVASWNSSVPGHVSTNETEGGAVGEGGPGAAGATKGAVDASETANGGSTDSSPIEENKNAGRAWNIRVASSAGSSEFSGLGSSSGGGARSTTAGKRGGSTALTDASADGGESDKGVGTMGGGGGNGNGSAQSSSRASLTSRVFSRSSGSGKIGASSSRFFASTGPAARIGVTSTSGAGSGVESADEGRARSASFVQQMIQTYEKSSESDEKVPTAAHEWPLSTHSHAEEGGKRNSKIFSSSGGGRRRGSRAAAGDGGGNAATESEADDENPVERPKLSYKRKKKKSPPSASRPTDAVGSDAEAPSPALNAAHGGSTQVRPTPTTLPRDDGRKSDGNPNGPGSDDSSQMEKDSLETYDGEEPYERPKLSYKGGGFRSGSSQGAFASSSR